MAPNHGGDSVGSILGPMGSHWVQKMGQNRKKFPCPQIRIFDYPAVINFSPKMEVSVIAPNHGGDPLGSILGPMGSHWVLKMGKNRKKITMPQNSNFRLPRGHPFSAKMELTDMQPNHCGDTLGAILGPIGFHWVQKMSQNRKNFHAQKFEFSTSPRSSIFRKKWKLRLSLQITVGPPRVHLGANGVPLGPKNGSKP